MALASVLLRRREMPSTASATSPVAKDVSRARQQAELAAHHQADDAVHRGVRHRAAADMAAVAQHRVAVADLEDLLQPVGHEDDGNALALEARG